MAKRPKTKRIYYGPEGKETSLYWTVRVADAKKNVTVNGDVLHALKGAAGTTVGCGLSQMACDPRNVNAFPHPVFLASFSKATCWIVDKLNKAGQPAHAIRYEHSYGHITDANDKGVLTAMAKEKPEVMSRPFTLRVPRKQVHKGSAEPRDTANKTPADKRPRASTFVHRGAMARAVKAGRIAKPVADQLSQALR